MSGRLLLPLFEQRAQARLHPTLRLGRPLLERVRDLPAQGGGLVEAQAVHHLAGDALRLMARPSGGLRGAPLRGPGRGARAHPDHGGQDLAGDARRPLAHALQDHLGQDHGREVLAALLVHHFHVVPGGHELAQPRHRHVAAGVRVVELAVAVAPHQAGTVLARLPGHGRTLTRCVMPVNME